MMRDHGMPSATTLDGGDQLLRTLFDNVLDAVVLFDGEGRFLEVNRVVASFIGYSREELRGMRLRDVTTADRRADFDAVWERFATERHLRGEAPMRRRDGSVAVITYRVVGDIRPGIHLLLAQDVTAQRRVEDSERFQAQLLEAVGEAVVATDLEGRIRYWNTGAERLWGWAGQEAIGRMVCDVGVPDALVEQGRELRARAVTGEPWQGEFLTHGRDGRPVPVLATNEVYVDEHGAPAGVIAIVRDITELKHTERLLDRRVQQQRAVAELGRLALGATDPGVVRDHADRIIGEVLARAQHPGVVVVGPDTADGTDLAAGIQLTLTADGQVQVRAGNELLDDQDHEFLRGVANVLRAADAQHRYSTQLVHASTHDRVTGLANRSLLLQQIEGCRTRNGTDHRPCAVMMLDVDRFRAVNNGLGHEAGDEVLRLIGAHLRGLARPDDAVASLGADRFALVCPGIVDSAAAIERAEAIRRGFGGTLDTPYGQLAVTVSVGVAVATGTETGESLLRDADTALDWAKFNGRNRVEVFEAPMLEDALYGFNITLALRRALQEDGIRVVYQPTIDLGTGRMVGVEALARLQLPNGTIISPAQFIPVAERTGLMAALGARVLDRACRDLATWLATDPTFVVSVNVSPRQLRDRRLVDTVRQRLVEHGVPPSALCIEITESELLSSPEARATLQRLHDLGIALAIDDFGTGFSSLSQLRTMPVNILKIDRSFVGGVDRQGPDRTLVTAAMDIAHTFELVTTGEGVETIAQRDALVAMGCDLGQGYLWSPPVAPEAIAGMLSQPVLV